MKVIETQIIRVNGHAMLARNQGGREGWVNMGLSTVENPMRIEMVHSVPDWWWKSPDAWPIRTGGNSYAKGAR